MTGMSVGRQVHWFSGNSYKGYTTRAEAESRYARYLAGEEGALEEPDEDQFHRDDAHRDDRNSSMWW